MNHSESVIDNYNKPFAVRFRELCKDTPTAAMLREFLGVTSQTISQFKLGTTLPKTENLIRIADFFNVSVDFLLGRTNTASQDVTIQTVCSKTGLSQTAVERLAVWTSADDRRKLWSGYISEIIEHDSFEYLLSRLGNYLIASKVESLALKAGDKKDTEESLNEEMACLYAITKTMADIIEDMGAQRRLQLWQTQK